MKALVTGASGTVGRALVERLERGGHRAVGWPRERVPNDDYHAMEAFVRAEAPDVVYHLAVASRPTGRPGESWLVNYEWSSELAWVTRVLGLGFVFTSTAMVFSDDARGPFTPESEPDAREGYGYEKRMAEGRVRYQNPAAKVVRLGWQIGREPGSNNMIDHLVQKARELGRVPASRRWLPATSFLEDTADALVRLADAPPGLYHLDANGAGHSFYDIASALSRLHGGVWPIEPNDDFVYDQRLLDGRVPVTPLAERLPGLGPGVAG
ncbi:MAG TPA: sugar nucleotide-binding protein [Polyangiaceae bacterium]|nr:sugar nucleotide-binding protein [Polyangiaceae bacterium]